MKKVTGSLDWVESNVAAVGSAGAGDVNLGQIAVGCALGYLDRFSHRGVAIFRAGRDQRRSMERSEMIDRPQLIGGYAESNGHLPQEHRRKLGAKYSPAQIEPVRDSFFDRRVHRFEDNCV